LFQRQWLEVLFTAAMNEHNSIVDYVLSQIPRDSGYNSECLNLIYRLINCEKDEVAFKVFLTMKQAPKDPKLNTSGASFVRHLVKRNRPVNTIMGFCDEIASKGINPRIYFICLSISNTNGNADLTAALLERIKGQKEEITPRMFWSLLVKKKIKKINLNNKLIIVRWYFGVAGYARIEGW
jgi:leucine-rich PPR motif-containing protein, mitochondrial